MAKDQKDEPISDAQLVKMLRANKGEVWRRLYAEYAPSLRRFARRELQKRPYLALTPDDVLHEVLDVLFTDRKKLAGFDERRGGLLGYLKAITIQEIVHLSRRKSRPREQQAAERSFDNLLDQHVDDSDFEDLVVSFAKTLRGYQAEYLLYQWTGVQRAPPAWKSPSRGHARFLECSIRKKGLEYWRARFAVNIEYQETRRR